MSDPSPPDPNQIDGHLVVLKPERALRHWQLEAEGEGDPAAHRVYVRALRSALPTIDPSRYRGIQRDAIGRWWEGEASLRVRRPDDRARRRIWELYGPDPCLAWTQPPWFDPDLLPTLEIAREILSLTDAPSDREIVRVTRNDASPTPRTLGFDVGYWGSDHFSLVADAMIVPRWHGCPPERLGSLEPWARALNDHQLFRTAAETVAYRDWYLDQPWAEEESEPGEFQVVRVDLVP